MRAIADDSQVADNSISQTHSSQNESQPQSLCSSYSKYNVDNYSLCNGGAACDDSDHDNNQRRAVSRRISELSRRFAAQQHRELQAKPQQALKFEHDNDDDNDDENDIEYADDIADLSQFAPGQHHQLPADCAMLSQAYARHQQHVQGRANQRARKQHQDISTVAWMIILGDGLHNFIDGISIGAAFSESILSGVSISVAVICEEFPHELGDFAVLISSGMTVRQALGYNFLSACTCYLGMAVGIILGDVTDGASYISALAAGVFLYIALVDMMGELSAALEASSRESIARTLKLLLLQNVGIAIGISIIFVLSFIDF